MSECNDRCSLCGDEALPALVRSVDVANATAEVELAGELQRVGLDLVDAVEAGDTLLVHQGFAIARLQSEIR